MIETQYCEKSSKWGMLNCVYDKLTLWVTCPLQKTDHDEVQSWIPANKINKIQR